MTSEHVTPDSTELPRLIDAGFELIPLHQWDAVGPRGRMVGKAPVGRDWWSKPSMNPDKAAEHMAEGGNVGIPLGKPVGDGFLCAYDIDLKSLPNGVRDMRRVVRSIAEDLGAADITDLVIHQSGNDGLHVFFRSAEPDLAGHADVGGVRVEVKSKGQQVVAPGSVHPDTGRLYQIHPDSAAHGNLPVAPAELVAKLRKPTSSRVGTQVWAPSRVGWMADQIRAAVDIGADVFEDYDDWIKGGMAFHAASGGDDYGLDAWVACSHAGEADHCADKWRSFGDGGVTERTLNHYLAAAGADPADAPPLTADEFADFVAADFAELGDDELPPRPRGRLLGLGELIDLPEPEWLLKRAIPRNGLVALYGPPKSGKTFLALDLALSVGSGREQMHGLACERGKVLYVLAEGGAPMMGNRARAWLASKGVDDSDVAVLPSAVILSSRKSVDALLDDMAGERWDLVVVDTLARCMEGDENSVKDMNAAIRGCDLIRERTGAAVMLVHHTGKDQTKGMRGSTALLGAIDGSMRMRPLGGSSIELSVPELRHGEPPEPAALSLQPTHGSAVLIRGSAADADVATLTLEAASHLDDSSPRKRLTDLLMDEFGISASTAKRRIGEHIPSGEDGASAYGGRRIWREKDGSSDSPNAEVIRVA